MTNMSNNAMRSRICSRGRMKIAPALAQETLTNSSRMIYAIQRVIEGIPCLELKRKLDRPDSISHEEIMIQYLSEKVRVQGEEVYLTRECSSYIGREQNTEVEVIQRSNGNGSIFVWNRADFTRQEREYQNKIDPRFTL